MNHLRKTKYIGTVDHVSKHHAFIVLEQSGKKDIFVTSRNLGEAMHHDRVEITLLPTRGRSKREEGRITKILKRGYKTIVGTIEIQGDRMYCHPDHRRLYPILIPTSLKEGHQENDKVIVKIIRRSNVHNMFIGEIVRNLGKIGGYQAETASILEQFQLNEKFADTIEKTVAQIPAQLSKEEIATRRDFTQVPTFTIDPVDAKDFDDALSLRTLPNGDHEIGVHIADVTHYVKEDTPLDKEAYKRATSVYLVGKVVPMLPERLANDLCSLKPNVQRPAFAAVFTITPQAQVKDLWIGETVIYSNRRFTYEEAHHVITTGEGAYHKELHILNSIAKQLRKRRLDAGAINFETTDIQVVLNEANEPIDIKPKQTIITHQLIEEFMLLANKMVAERIVSKQKGNTKKTHFIYRTHESPKEEKLANFTSFVTQLNYSFSTNKDQLAASFNHILQKSKGTLHEEMIQTLAIRTMGQAHYTTEEKGHFGLGFPHYTHFTSPIRRYPDIIAHRLIKQELTSIPATKRYDEAVAKHCSLRERVAVEAERASNDLHQVIFLKKHEGKQFKGIISGVTSWGIYVEIITNKCEGMIRLTDLADHYILTQGGFALEGKNTQQIYRIGDLVQIEVKHCDIKRKTIDFVFAE